MGYCCRIFTPAQPVYPIATSVRDFVFGALTNMPGTLKLERMIPVRMKKRGVELKLVIGNERSRAASVDSVLPNTIARAHRWLDWLVSGEVKSLNEIAAREDNTSLCSA